MRNATRDLELLETRDYVRAANCGKKGARPVDDGSAKFHARPAAGLVRAVMATTLLAVIVGSAVAWSWDPAIAKGIAVGGVAGAVGFALMTRAARTLTAVPKAEISYRVYRWTFARAMLYAIALLFAYQVDPNGRNALLGAAGGLLIARAAVLGTGIVWWRWRGPVGTGPNS